MISADQFLSLLDEKDVLPKDLIADLRSKLGLPHGQISADELAQFLIQTGYFTAALAAHFLDEGQKRFATETTVPSGAKEDKEIGFAPIKEEPQPRVLRGKLRAHSLSEKTKQQGRKPTKGEISDQAKTSPSPISKKTLLDQPTSSPWSTSVYERETDSYKGLVSYRLAKLAGEEKAPEGLYVPEKSMWPTLLLACGIVLALLIILCLLI
ncbi:MAG TPA: hypothetical protein VIH42_00700 [Thermoguttaceae bacterium]